MPRGGKRQGAPGKAYANRSDLNAPQSRRGINVPAPGQGYGQGAAQAAQMKAVNIAPPAGVTPAPLDPLASAEAWQPIPGDPTQTARPGEPPTAGLPTGPGPGPEAIPQMIAPPADPVGASIADMYHALLSQQTSPRLVDAQFARMLRMTFDENA